MHPKPSQRLERLRREEGDKPINVVHQVDSNHHRHDPRINLPEQLLLNRQLLRRQPSTMHLVFRRSTLNLLDMLSACAPRQPAVRRLSLALQLDGSRHDGRTVSQPAHRVPGDFTLCQQVTRMLSYIGILRGYVLRHAGCERVVPRNAVMWNAAAALRGEGPQFHSSRGSVL
jgi:hypothetical protein